MIVRFQAIDDALAAKLFVLDHDLGHKKSRPPVVTLGHLTEGRHGFVVDLAAGNAAEEILLEIGVVDHAPSAEVRESIPKFNFPFRAITDEKNKQP